MEIKALRSEGFSNDDNSYFWQVEYVGSFAVSAEIQASEAVRAEFVRRQLSGLREAAAVRRVLILISVGGFKICSLDGTRVHMAHALKRISYATSDPDSRQFAFLAREPRSGRNSTQYCHVFATESADQTTDGRVLFETNELNASVGAAFRAAYIYKLDRLATTTTSDDARKGAANTTAHDQMAAVRLFRRERQRADSDGTPPPSAASSSESRADSSATQDCVDELPDEPNLSARLHAAEMTARRCANDQSGNYPPSKNPPVPPRTGRVPLSPIVAAVSEPHSLSTSGAPKRPPPPKIHAPSTLAEEWITELSPALTTAEPASRVAATKGGCLLNHGFDLSEALAGDLGHDGLIRAFERPPKQRLGDLPSSSGGAESERPRLRGSTKLLRKLFGSSGRQRRASGEARSLAESAAMSQSVILRPRERKRRPVSSMFSSAFGLDKAAAAAEDGRRTPGAACRLSGRSASATAAMSTSVYAVKPSAKVNRKSVHADWLMPSSNGPIKANHHPPINGCDSDDAGCGPRCQRKSISPGFPCAKSKQDAEFLVPISEGDELSIQDAPWYAGDVDRDFVADLLRDQEEGAFVVRKSASQRCCFALSVRVGSTHNPRCVSHYLVLRTTQGFKLKGFVKNFATVQSLVTHHSVMMEQLPCRLKFVNWNQKMWSSARAQRRSVTEVISEEVYGGLEQ